MPWGTPGFEEEAGLSAPMPEEEAGLSAPMPCTQVAVEEAEGAASVSVPEPKGRSEAVGGMAVWKCSRASLTTSRVQTIPHSLSGRQPDQ